MCESQYKEFQFGDVAVSPPASVANSSYLRSILMQANLLGSSIGLCIAYYMERYYRHRREVCCMKLQLPHP